MKQLITILVSLTIMIGQNKVVGLTYFDFTQNEDESGFNFKRQYISVSGSSGEDMRYKVVMDVGRYGDDNRLTAFLKKAQADYTTNYGKISLGLIGMNTYGVQEKNWGYRFISKSAIDKNKFSEVLLLTDTSHSLPIKSKSNNFFCNANGSGRPEIITCSYNPLVWDEEINLEHVFYTSGLGGIYPKDIKIGYVKDIEQVNSTITILEIKLFANPLDSHLFGVLKY